MSIIDDIFSILKGANPDASDDAVRAQAEQLSQSPDADKVMAPITTVTSSQTGLGSPTVPPIPPSSFDVATSDNTVTQNGSTPAAQAPEVPAALPALAPPPPSAQAPIPAPSAPAATSVPTPAAKPMSTSAPISPDVDSTMTLSHDNDARKAMLADQEKKRKLGIIPNAIAGIGDAISGASAAFGGKGTGGAQERVIENQQKDQANVKSNFEESVKNDPNSDVSKSYRQMVLQIAPNIASQADFQNMSAKDIGDKLPLIDTMMKAKAAEDSKKLSLESIKANKDVSLGLRNDQQQDKLEQNAKQMVSNLRGDKSLARTEEQRDAAAVAYNRLKEIQTSGEGLNPVDYADILGQVYKARTGTAPGEQIMKDIHQATAQGSLDKAYTYVTGQQAPATSQDITASLMNMAKSMGQQADKMHDGYMNAHLIKPVHLKDETWDAIKNTNRGMSFAEATNQNADSSKSAAGNDPLGLR